MSERRVALVSGANRGIGLEVVRQLAKLGMTALLGARDRSKGTAAAAKLASEGIEAPLVALDVTDPKSVVSAVADMHARFGRIDVLVNNAGIALDGRRSPVSSVLELSPEIVALRGPQAHRLVNATAGYGLRFATWSIAINSRIRPSNSSSGTMLGPSEGARSGSWCVSMKTPATPTATAARASVGTNRRSPPDEAPCPPGCCTACVASKITGQPIWLMIGSARMSTTSVL